MTMINNNSDLESIFGSTEGTEDKLPSGYKDKIRAVYANNVHNLNLDDNGNITIPAGHCWLNIQLYLPIEKDNYQWVSIGGIDLSKIQKLRGSGSYAKVFNSTIEGLRKLAVSLEPGSNTCLNKGIRIQLNRGNIAKSPIEADVLDVNELFDIK